MDDSIMRHLASRSSSRSSTRIGGASVVASHLELKYPNLNIGVFTKSLVFYEAFMSTTCFLSLGGLCLWHARLISAGQTSIEAHINKRGQGLAQLGRLYRNPYNFGLCTTGTLYCNRGWWL